MVYLARGIIYFKVSEPGPLSAILIQKHLIIRKKNSLQNFRNCKLIHKTDHESFPPQTIYIMQYSCS